MLWINIFFWALIITIVVSCFITFVTMHDISSECVPNPTTSCTQEYAPVCGIDKRTYSNYCEARRLCITVVHEGECDSESASK